MYSNPLQFALKMETLFLEDLIALQGNDSSLIQRIAEPLISLQEQICNLLSMNIHASIFPIVDLAMQLDEHQWQAIIKELAKTPATPDHLHVIWSILMTFDKPAQFYRQLAANSPNPALTIFASSLAEIKKIGSRKIEGILRISVNSTWEQLGFCPFGLINS